MTIQKLSTTNNMFDTKLNLWVYYHYVNSINIII